MLSMVVAAFGLIWMIKGEIKVSKRRRIDKGTGRRLGAFMFIGAIALSFMSIPDGLFFIIFGILMFLPFIIGFALSEEIQSVR
jgi:hypothetical protein